MCGILVTIRLLELNSGVPVLLASFVSGLEFVEALVIQVDCGDL